MCGRFTLYDPPDRIAHRFGAELDSETIAQFRPSWNVAPNRTVLAITGTEMDAGASEVTPIQPLRILRPYRWGLVPSWAKDALIGQKLINARAETVPTKPAFRSAFRHRRCLVVANGFYEWRQPGEPGTRKTPFYFHRRDNEPIALAGLWETWPGSGNALTEPPLRSCTIITTVAGEDVSDVHDRMPLILEADEWDEWLDLHSDEPGFLLSRERGSVLARYEVAPTVNSARNDGEELVRPAAG